MELDELKKQLQALKEGEAGGQPPAAGGEAEPPTGTPPAGEAVPPVTPPDMPPPPNLGGAGEGAPKGAAAPYLTMDNFGKDFRVTLGKGHDIIVDLKCNPDAFFFWVMQYGQHTEVLEPASMRERIQQAAKAIQMKYS